MRCQLLQAICTWAGRLGAAPIRVQRFQDTAPKSPLDDLGILKQKRGTVHLC
jgi:hypothetical protein